MCVPTLPWRKRTVKLYMFNNRYWFYFHKIYFVLDIVIYMTFAPMVLVVVIRGINSKDEQGNDNIIVTRRPRQLHGN